MIWFIFSCFAILTFFTIFLFWITNDHIDKLQDEIEKLNSNSKGESNE